LLVVDHFHASAAEPLSVLLLCGFLNIPYWSRIQLSRYKNQESELQESEQAYWCRNWWY